MAFILVCKQNNKPMKVVGSQLESQKTIKTATIFNDSMAKIFEAEMGDSVEVKFIQTNRVQDVIIEQANKYINRNTLMKLEAEYMAMMGY